MDRIPSLVFSKLLCAGLFVCSFLFQASAIADSGMTVFSADGLLRVRPGDAPLTNRSILIKAARNEYEPFQVVVHAGGKSLSGVNARMSEFRGPKGRTIAAQNAKLYREHYVEVRQPVPKSKEGPGWYPDARSLVP